MTVITSTLILLLLSFSPSEAFRCSVSSCSYFGGRAMCCPFTPCIPVACAVWHATQSSQICHFPCPSTCAPPALRPIATDAIAYCNNCTLARASCKYGFDIHGPIDHGVTFAVAVEPISTETPTPSLPSTAPASFPRPHQSPDPFFDSDFLQTSPDLIEFTTEPSPEETPFMDATPFPTMTSSCSIEYCSQYGSRAECFSSSNLLTTCLNWSVSGPMKECPIICPSTCNLSMSAPLASDGRRYCSLCHLRLISCLTGYMITGPVPNVSQQPVPEDSSVQVLY